MALSCMRCPAGVAAVRRMAAPPPSRAALSFARCSFGRSAAAGWRIDAVAAKGGPMDVGVENAVTPAAPSKVENGTPSAITLEEFEDLSALSKNDESTVSITVVGASGDLAKKKIFPALFALYYEDCLPKHFTIFGYARSKMTDPELRNMVSRTLTCRIDKRENCSEKMEEFLKRCFYHSGQYDSEEHFMELAKKLKQHEGSRVSNRLFYLSIPPNIFLEVVKCASNSASSANGSTRVIVEKPFGRDLDSSAALTRGLKQYLVEDQIFRIDHYLGKELVENLSVLRFSNLVFEPLWSRQYIRNVQLIFSEDFGTEGRGGYCDSYGPITHRSGGCESMLGKFHPVYQFFYFDYVESLPVENLETGDLKPENSRYDAQISVFESKLQKKLEHAKIFETAWGQAAFQGGRNVMDRPGAEGFGHGPWAQEASESGVQESRTTATRGKIFSG